MEHEITSRTAAQDLAVTITGISRSFGPVKALSDATLTISRGEKLGLIGHNGAGKSTLMNVLSGVFQPDAGTITVSGTDYDGLSPVQMHELGIRCIFQELSLSPNLTAIENTMVRQRHIAGWGWRKRAKALISASLDRVFPGHGIDISLPIGEMEIAQRQMIEIAEAFSGPAPDTRLVILDEPTSSLDSKVADQLMAFLDVASRDGIATILISHRLKEILSNTDRVVVMVDGKIVNNVTTDGLTREKLVDMMGHLEVTADTKTNRVKAGPPAPVVLAAQGDTADPLRLVLHQGEVIGFAGLDGHGQRQTLQQIFSAAAKGKGGMIKGSAAYVPGDRQTEGVFSVWSVRENTTIRALRDISSYGIINLSREHSLASGWFRRVGVRTAGPDAAIGSLSGGNQQKVLVARALASTASLILLDDPMRGVDVGTKSEVYALIRAEAKAGRSFIWYSTETDELRNCDRVFVFREGRIVASLNADEVTEDNILRASFTDEPVRESINA